MENNIKKIETDAQFLQVWSDKNLGSIDFLNLSYLFIDLNQKHIQMLSTDVKWYQKYWQSQLDKDLSLRLQKKTTYWSELNLSHRKFLERYRPNTKKVDLCIHNEDSFEILSIHTKKMLHMDDYVMLYQALPSLSYHAHKFRCRANPPNLHPIRDNRVFSLTLKKECNPVNLIFDQEKRYRFDSFNLTALEIKYLQCLSALMSQKEIAYRYNVSETAVRKVIYNIKRKLGNESMPNSQLFCILKQVGATKTYINHAMA
jgi:DNA-binding CsgD family transcriptional regulator